MAVISHAERERRSHNYADTKEGQYSPRHDRGRLCTIFHVFGAGNVIFPPYLGLESGSAWLGGFSAYFIADIGLAMLAMFALLRVGSTEAIILRIGKVPSQILMCAIILCIGPMLAIPRTSATTYEMAIMPNVPAMSAVLFSVLFFALILALCIKESAVVDIVGKILTPLLLLGLAAIIIKGVITPLGPITAAPQIDNVAVTGIKPAIRQWMRWPLCPSVSSCCKAY